MAPFLKAAGFRKQGNRFLKEAEVFTYIVTTYKSQWNTKEHLAFRIEWGLKLNEPYKQFPIPFYAEVLYGEMFCLTQKHQHAFFELKQSDEDIEKTDSWVKNEIKEGVAKSILPFLFSLRRIEDVIKLLETTPLLKATWSTPLPSVQTEYWRAYLYCFINEPQKGIEILNDALIKIKYPERGEGFLKKQGIESRKQLILNAMKAYTSNNN